MTGRGGPNRRLRGMRRRIQKQRANHDQSLGSRPLTEEERRQILRRDP